MGCVFSYLICSYSAKVLQSKKFCVGDAVRAQYKRKWLCSAVIDQDNLDGTYTLFWNDRDTEDTVKHASEIVLDTGGFRVGDAVHGLYKRKWWCDALIQGQNADGTFTLAWTDGDTEDKIKLPSDLSKRNVLRGKQRIIGHIDSVGTSMEQMNNLGHVASSHHTWSSYALVRQ